MNDCLFGMVDCDLDKSSIPLCDLSSENELFRLFSLFVLYYETNEKSTLPIELYNYLTLSH